MKNGIIAVLDSVSEALEGRKATALSAEVDRVVANIDEGDPAQDPENLPPIGTMMPISDADDDV